MSSDAPVGESPQKAEWQPMRTLIDGELGVRDPAQEACCVGCSCATCGSVSSRRMGCASAVRPVSDQR